ncbi:hypothetical protein BDZ85DRAFT_266208 [Elsinoe ampelina]|uniref:Uncharacterized protein n=1 Tax=Elsinoe ampelina TaxID=302913 RepID=A0A6A6G5T5_9PEZI|nr:hypothetical protein BDZ85DRAFT_266208 [Elsinoe ampelina]
MFSSAVTLMASAFMILVWVLPESVILVGVHKIKSFDRAATTRIACPLESQHVCLLLSHS